MTTLPKFLVSVAVAVALICPPPVEATDTLTESFRFEWSSGGQPDTGAAYGARVTITEGLPPRALIGAPGPENALVEFLTRDSGSWQVTTSTSGPPQPLAMASDGNARLRSRYEPITPDGTSVLAESTLLVSTLPGGPIEAIARDSTTGAILAVGQPDHLGVGRVSIYEPDEFDHYMLTATFLGGTGDRLGASLAVDGSVVVAGAPGDGPNGSVKVYVKTDQWIELQHIDSPATSQVDAGFGESVELLGDLLAVGSPDVDKVTAPGARTDVGAVYIYEAELLLFEFATLLRPAGAFHEDHVGTSVALHDFGPGGLGVALAIGTPGEDVIGTDEGAVHFYTFDGASWSHAARLIDSAGGDGDALGTSVSMGEGGILAGAPSADANGVPQQGAALFFDSIFPVTFADDFESGDAGAWSAVN